MRGQAAFWELHQLSVCRLACGVMGGICIVKLTSSGLGDRVYVDRLSVHQSEDRGEDQENGREYRGKHGVVCDRGEVRGGGRRCEREREKREGSVTSDW